MMQESVLPERLLYYGTEQLYWNFQTNALSEGSVFPEPPIWSLASDMRSFEGNPKSALSPLLFSTWYGLVEEYSTRILTTPTNAFDAFAVIASLFEKNDGEYVAGYGRMIFIEDFSGRLPPQSVLHHQFILPHLGAGAP
jgi:hypothetical protein